MPPWTRSLASWAGARPQKRPSLCWQAATGKCTWIYGLQGCLQREGQLEKCRRIFRILCLWCLSTLWSASSLPVRPLQRPFLSPRAGWERSLSRCRRKMRRKYDRHGISGSSSTRELASLTECCGCIFCILCMCPVFWLGLWRGGPGWVPSRRDPQKYVA